MPAPDVGLMLKMTSVGLVGHDIMRFFWHHFAIFTSKRYF